MASSLISFTPSTTRIFAATAATKSAGGGKEEKGFLDFILGNLIKEDQFYETDPILKKVEEKSSSSSSGRGGITTSGRKNSVAVPPKKKGGFGGLFAKN